MSASTTKALAVFEKSSFLPNKTYNKKSVTDSCIGYAIDIVLPQTESSFSSDLIMNHPYYWIENFSIRKLLQPEFIAGFIQTGELCLQSDNTRIAVDDCVTLLPTGVLLLHVTKDTYEILGFEGKKCKTHMLKYEIRINLKEPHFQPGNKRYERAVSCFRRHPLIFDALMYWIPRDSNICSSSVAMYLSNQSQGHKCIQKLVQTCERTRLLKVPNISCTSQHHMDILEWLGAVLCDISCEETDKFISTFSCPEPCSQLKCTVYEHRGFISSQYIGATIESLRLHIKTNGCPWASLTIHDCIELSSPSGCTKTYLVFPDDNYWLYRLS